MICDAAGSAAENAGVAAALMARNSAACSSSAVAAVLLLLLLLRLLSRSSHAEQHCCSVQLSRSHTAVQPQHGAANIAAHTLLLLSKNFAMLTVVH
jgi:hypothetical protein